MGKTIAVILISIILLTSFVSCKNDPGCTIKFYANGGTGEMSDQTVGVNQTTSLKANAFTKDNCIFTGWNTEANGSGTAYADCAELTVTKSMDLYAQWAVKGVIITFDSNNLSGETNSQLVPLHTPTALRENTFTNGSLGFAGWNTKEDGSGTSYADGAQIEATQKMTLYAQWGIILTDDIVFLTGSICILNSNVTWNDRKFVDNNVRLLLHDGFTLTAEKGIHVPIGASLTIDADGEGTGRIVASSTDDAGIGGGGGGDKGGTIIINGGIINAESGTGAGIGGGIGTNGCHVTINNGTITATSDSGAGIGGGQSGAGGQVTINGGTITATSTFGAGIGGGGGGDGGTVTINNGTINATSNSGAGIGGGDNGNGGPVTINNGIIIITSFSGAGIGGGDGGNGGPVIINGGDINTGTGSGAVGIGRGYFGTSDGALDLGTGVSLIVSDDNSNWSSYDGTRKHYMKTPL